MNRNVIFLKCTGRIEAVLRFTNAAVIQILLRSVGKVLEMA